MEESLRKLIEFYDKYSDRLDTNFDNKNTSGDLLELFLSSQEITNSENTIKDISNIAKSLDMTEYDFTNLLSAVVLYNTKKDFPQAMEILQLLGEKYPKNINILYYQGIIYNDVSMTDSAIDCFEAIIDIDPDNYPAKMGIANSMMLSGEYNDAIIQYKNIAQEYKEIEPIIFIGITYNLMQDHKNALKTFDKVEKMNKTIELSGYRGYTYFLMGDYDNSIRFYLDALSKDTSSLEYNLMLGKIYNIKGDLQKARNFLLNCIDESITFTNPDLILDALYELGKTYYNFNDYENAIKYFDAVIEKNFFDIDSHAQKAQCLINMGKLKEAKQLVYDVMAEIGEDDSLLEILAQIERM